MKLLITKWYYQQFNTSGTLDEACNAINELEIKDSKINTNISIKSDIIHKYTFTILFKKINSS